LAGRRSASPGGAPRISASKEDTVDRVSLGHAAAGVLDASSRGRGLPAILATATLDLIEPRASDCLA
jgi:hypothetical protein